MDGSDNSLEINIQAQDNASETLNEVASTASEMADSVTEAAQAISESFQQTDDQLQELADASYAAAESWMGSMEEITTSTGDAVAAIGDETSTAGETLAENLYGPMNAAGQETLANLREQGTALEEAIGELGALSAEAWDAEFGPLIASEMEAEGETAGKSFGDGFMGTFRYLMLGYFASTFGSDIINAVTGTVSAAAGTPDKIAQLQAQIQSERATIASAQADLTKWNGTTVELAAAHEKAEASIQSATVKIRELQIQLAPLVAAQKGAAGTTSAYDTATLKLDADFQGLQGTLGGTLLPTLTQYALQLDDIVQATQKWAQAHPDLTEHLLEIASVLGEMIKLMGAALVGYALWSIAVKILVPDLEALAGWLGIIDTETAALGGGTLLLVAVAVLAVAAAVAALIAYWPQVQTFVNYWGEKLGVFEAVRSVWDQIATMWVSYVAPAIKGLWQQMQPLMPYLEETAKIFGVSLLVSLGIVAGLILGLVAATALLTEAVIVLVAWVGTKLVEAFDWLIDKLTTVESWFTSFPNAVQNAIQAIEKFFGLANTTPGLHLNTTSALGTISNTGFSSLIPQLASGGIVNSPTIAMIGEAGPEAVIPLAAFSGGSSLAGSGGGNGNGNIIVNITGTFLSQDAARQLSQMMIQSLNQRLRLSAF
jgi:hypothetical protein